MLLQNVTVYPSLCNYFPILAVNYFVLINKKTYYYVWKIVAPGARMLAQTNQCRTIAPRHFAFLFIGTPLGGP